MPSYTVPSLFLARCCVSESDLACIRAARDSVQQTLLSAGAGARMARLVKSDLLETLLVSALKVIQEDPAYRKAVLRRAREPFLALHLESAIAGWAWRHVGAEDEAEGLAKAERIIAGTHRGL